MLVHSALFVQARMGSVRFPGKVLLPLDGRVMLEVVLNNLYGCADVHLLVCPVSCAHSFLAIAVTCGYNIVVGSEEDVLSRFYWASQQFPSSWIIRATADNVAVSAVLAQKLLHECRTYHADYGCYKDTPHGGGVEVISTNALSSAMAEAYDPYDREHVCTFISSRPERFKLHTPLAPKCWRGAELRATIDTPKDYIYMKEFYEIGRSGQSEILEEFVAWAKKG